MQLEVPVKVKDLVETMSHIRTTLLSTSTLERAKAPGSLVADLMILIVNSGQHLVVVEVGILGTIVINTTIDGGSGVNVMSEATWKSLKMPMLWSPTFNLLGANQHGIKPLGTLMTHKIMINTQTFTLDFVVIPL